MKVRELFAEYGLDVDAQSFAKGELLAEAAKFALEKLVDVAKEAVAAFVENIKATAEYGEHMIGLAQSTGLGTDALQHLGAAAADEGVGVDDLARSIVFLSRNMDAAKRGSEESAKAFHQAGIKYKDSSGKLRGADAVFADIAEKFHKMPDGAEKTAMSVRLLGKEGTALIPILNHGKEGLEEFYEKSVMSREQLQAGNEVVTIQRQLTAQTKALWREAIGPLLPAIRDLLKRWQAWKKENAELLKLKIREWIGRAIDGIKLLGNTLDFLIKNIGGIKLGLEALAAYFVLTNIAGVAAAAQLALAWLAAAAPFIAIGALVAGMLLVFDDIRVYQKGGKSLYGRFKKEIDDWLVPRKEDPWFVAALKAFVRFIKEAIEGAAKLEDKLKNFGQQSAGGKVATVGAVGMVPLQAGSKALGLGELGSHGPANTRAEAALAGTGSYWEALKASLGFGAYGDYEPRAGGPAGGGVRAQQTNYVTIQGAGKSGAEISEELIQKLDQHWDEKWTGKMEEAGAAAGD